MQVGGAAALLGIILGLVLSLGSCAGIDTTPIEDLADGLGVEPIAIPLGDMGGADDLDWDDMDFETPWTAVETAEEAAEGAGVETFPDFMNLETSNQPESAYYYYEVDHAQAIVFYDGFAAFVDKAVYAGVDDIADDDRSFDLTWSETVDGIAIECSGLREGEICKAIFVNGDYVYSIDVLGYDDDPDKGISAEDLALIVSAML